MAKSTRRKYYKRKGRWCANIKNIADTATLASGPNGNSVDLCLNPLQSDITVSQIYTVKNIELSVFFETTGTSLVQEIEDIEHYIMYVPQGMNLTTQYNLEHPEYILAYKYQGNPWSDTTTAQFNLKIRSRLARRLNTGDRIIYFWKCSSSTSNTNVTVRGLVRWWTKAN